MEQTWQSLEASGAVINWGGWSSRMRRIHELISPLLLDGSADSVMDLGAGDMLLQTLLPPGVTYMPVDYVARCESTVVCDFNKHEFPDCKADIVVAAGILHFVEDVKWFLEQAYKACGKLFAITYTPLEMEPDVEKRRNVYLWVNHMPYTELYALFVQSGFAPVHIEKVQASHGVVEQLYILKKIESAMIPEFSGCTGCGLCAEMCPTEALHMEWDAEGFARPALRADRCVHCDRCVQNCPALHPIYTNEREPASYAAWAADEVRLQSSSGGMFTLLAQSILQQGGAVCGARFDPESQCVKHVLVRDPSELSALRGSKYVQSDIRDVLNPIKMLLQQNTPVLFCGCPCQVAAIKQYVGQDSGSLYTADLLCEGVTPPQIFCRYLAENYQGKTAVNVQFRIKERGWNPFHITVTFADGTKETHNVQQDAMEKIVHGFFALRPSCYACAFSTFPRQGDVTLGDFWGVQNYDADWDDQKGTSVVLVNNEKGEQMLSWLQRAAQRLETVPWQYTGTNRLTPIAPERCAMPQTRERFYSLLQTHSLQEAVERAVYQKYDVGVVCNWSGDNYGAQLTQYAFYYTLRTMGKEPIMIERPNMPYPGGNAPTPRLFRYDPYPGYALCALYDDLEQMRDINKLADTFVVPSDQLWNALFAEKDLFALGLIANNKRKIAYATSFGHDPYNGTEDERAREAFFLQQLDAVSVREESAVRILEQDFGVQGAVCTLDPVFLCGEDFYDALCGRSPYRDRNGHIASFILDPNVEKESFICAACESLGTNSIQFTDAFDSQKKAGQWALPVEQNIFVEDILALIRGSRFVITDSFHGVCFAILFKKPFVAIGNVQRGLSRFESLLGRLDLLERLVISTDESALKLLEQPIDYGSVVARLNHEREFSLKWLQTALNTPKKADLTAFDILDDKISDLHEKVRKIGPGNEERLAAVDRELLRINHGADAVNAELLQINQRADAVNAELLRINQRADVTNTELQHISQNADVAYTEQLRINRMIDSINAELLRVNRNTDGANSEQMRINGMVDAINAELLRINQNFDGANAEQLRINGIIDAINTELLRINQNADGANTEQLRINGMVDAINTELLRINQNFDGANAEQQRISGMVDAINTELLRINQNADGANTEQLRINGMIDAINAELLRINQNADVAMAERVKLRQVEDVIEARIKTVIAANEELRAETAELQRRLNRLERSPFVRLGNALVSLYHRITRWFR